MRRPGARIDVAIYATALAKLARHPSIVVMPLLAAVIDALFSLWGGAFTDPLGGVGNGLIALLVQIVYLYAFGVAIVQAKNVLRGRKGSFDEAWEESQGKAGSILMAAIGFQFIVWVAAYAGSILGVQILALVLQLTAYFFLILTIPAAAIGGVPGGAAISASIRGVRANVVPCLILAIVFALVWIGVPELMLYVGNGLGPFAYDIVLAVLRAIVLAYLAFPFAAVYDEVSIRPW